MIERLFLLNQTPGRRHSQDDLAAVFRLWQDWCTHTHRSKFSLPWIIKRVVDRRLTSLLSTSHVSDNPLPLARSLHSVTGSAQLRLSLIICLLTPRETRLRLVFLEQKKNYSILPFNHVDAMVKRTCKCIFTYTRDWNTTTTTYQWWIYILVSLFILPPACWKVHERHRKKLRLAGVFGVQSLISMPSPCHTLPMILSIN